MTGPFALVVSETPSHDVTETTLTRFRAFLESKRVQDLHRLARFT